MKTILSFILIGISGIASAQIPSHCRSATAFERKTYAHQICSRYLSMQGANINSIGESDCKKNARLFVCNESRSTSYLQLEYAYSKLSPDRTLSIQALYDSENGVITALATEGGE